MQMRCNGPLALRARAENAYGEHFIIIISLFYFIPLSSYKLLYKHGQRATSNEQRTARARTKWCIWRKSYAQPHRQCYFRFLPDDRRPECRMQNVLRTKTRPTVDGCKVCRALRGMREFGLKCQKSVFHAQTNATDLPKIFCFFARGPRMRHAVGHAKNGRNGNPVMLSMVLRIQRRTETIEYCAEWYKRSDTELWFAAEYNNAWIVRRHKQV